MGYGLGQAQTHPDTLRRAGHSDTLRQAGLPDTLWQAGIPDTLRERELADSSGERGLVDTLPAKKHVVKRSHLDVGMSYQSDNVYLGRKDSARLPYYIPAVSYYHKSGVYASASIGYLKNSTVSRLDLITLEAGYMFTAHKYQGMFTASKYFYNSQSTNVTSAITSSIAYQNGYDLGPVKPSLTVTLNIGDKVDYEGRLEIGHTFTLLNDNLDLSPSVSVAGSTLHYYDYYRKRRYTIKNKKGTQTGMADVSGSVLDASTFKLLDYELLAPIEYTIGKCTFSFTPIYSIPVNAVTIGIHTARDNGTTVDRTKTEGIEDAFYFTLGVNFLF